MCSLSTPPGHGRGECRPCLWPRERASSCVLTERKQSWVARWCPVNVRQQACFTDCLYFLCALPDDASAPHIGFCLNGVGSVGRVPVTKATKCYAFSTMCIIFQVKQCPPYWILNRFNFRLFIYDEYLQCLKMPKMNMSYVSQRT